MRCDCKSIITQVLAIIAIGAVVGLADPRVWKLNLVRPKPPPVVVVNEGNGKVEQTPPGPATATPGFVPTKKKDMPEGQITLDEAKALYDQHAVFIDARKPEEYKAGHVKGAYRMTEDDFRFGNPPILAAIPRESKLIVYCKGGHCDESEMVARFLSGSGYTIIYVMHDGYPGWKSMGFPFETGEGMQ